MVLSYPSYCDNHRLFTAYDGPVEQGSDLGVDAASGHIAVLCHRYLGVAEMVGANPRRQPFVVDEGCNGLAEAVRGHVREVELVPHEPPVPAEVVRIAPRAGRGRKDHLLLAVEGHPAAGGEHVDRKLWQRQCSVEDSWMDYLELLRAFADREGHTLVSVDYVENGLKLGQRVRLRRKERKKLSSQRQALLEAIPGWFWGTKSDYVWDQRFALLAKFAAREGHARVPGAYVEDGLNLGSWVAVQRAERENLSPERRARLEALPGWSWGVIKDSWDEKYANWSRSSPTARVIPVSRRAMSRMGLNSVRGCPSSGRGATS